MQVNKMKIKCVALNKLSNFKRFLIWYGMVQIVKLCLATFGGGLAEFILGFAFILFFRDRSLSEDELSTVGTISTIVGFVLLGLGCIVMLIGIVRWLFLF